ncbi:MAG: hypothetical protein K6F86_11780 [Lachnospiraceae bacterium]|nr:hypothetical protein [Lachnospiraceae bacterium]
MKKIVITVITALAVICAAVIFKNVYSCEMPIKNRGIRDAINSGDLEVVFLGSSTFRANVDMPLMDEAYNGRVYDISYGGNELVATAIQYEEIKKRSPHDYGLFVFELGPMMLTQEVSLSDSRVIWDLSWGGKRKLWESMRSSGKTGLSVMYEYFVTSGMDDLITFPVTEPFYSTRYYKGAKTDETVSPGKDVLETEEFDISKEEFVKPQEDAVYDIIKACRSDGQDFIFVESPCYHRLQEDGKYKECRERYILLLEKEDVPYILADDVEFDTACADFFEDMNHMSAKGRKTYTKELIRVLKERKEK